MEAVYSAITKHLHDEHVVADKDHFCSWSAVAESKEIYYVPGFVAWEAWYARSSGILICTTCGVSEGVVAYMQNIKHQQSMLVPSSELYPYRQAIRNLWPEFASHPVFKD